MAMAAAELVEVWEVTRSEVSAGTPAPTRPPSFRAVVLSTTADTLGLQVVGDDLPSGGEDPIRVERWPRAGEKRPCVLLKLKAWSAK
jgi:hypothetical protein